MQRRSSDRRYRGTGFDGHRFRLNRRRWRALKRYVEIRFLPGTVFREGFHLGITRGGLYSWSMLRCLVRLFEFGKCSVNDDGRSIFSKPGLRHLRRLRQGGILERRGINQGSRTGQCLIEAFKRIENMAALAAADIPAMCCKLLRPDPKPGAAGRTGGDQAQRLTPLRSTQFSIGNAGCMSNQVA